MTIKHLAITLMTVFSLTLFCTAQAQQMPMVSTVNLKIEPESITLSAGGDVVEMRLEVLNAAGDVVFESQTIDSKVLKWEMQDSAGARVRDGIYMCTITYRNAAGKVRKRIEQVMILGAKQTGDAMSSPEAVQAAITGAGTAGKIAKFTGTTTIGNSVITEGAAGNIGVNDAAPTSRLTVAGGDIEIKTASRGVKFSDGSLQTKAALTDVEHDATLAGDGTAASPLSLPVPFSLSGNNAGAILSVTNTGSGAAISATGAINTDSQYNIGGQRMLSRPGITNTFVGLFAGNANTTGTSNSFFGDNAGRANTTGGNNSFFGRSAGSNNTTGSYNSFFGDEAGRANTTGHDNAFFGQTTGTANTTGYGNAFFGSQAGFSNTTGFSNSFFGEGAGRANTTGKQNAFFGKNAGTANTTGMFNSFFGEGAGGANTTGHDNAFFGKDAGRSNTTGEANSFFGVDAGRANTDSEKNSFFGFEAGKANTTGLVNSFFGAGAGKANTTGSNNSFFGVNAGEAVTTGRYNTIIGTSAGGNFSSYPLGDSNTLIGYNAEGAAGIHNSTAIGANVTVTTSNTMVLGTNIVTVQVPGHLKILTLGPVGTTSLCRNISNHIATCSSSLRYKTEVQTYASGLEIVRRLRPISFSWRDGAGRDLGLAAEEVAAVEPLLVTHNAQGQIEGVKYGQLNVLLINAIQQQQEQIKQQQEQIERLRKLICEDHPQAEVCKTK